MNSTEPAVLAQGVSRRYGPVLALDDFSLAIEPGEVFCLLGPNGSGKTTFMRVLAGFLSMSAGTLHVGGLDVAANALEVRKRIGYVPESVPMYRHMRVGEFLAFIARLREVPEARVNSAVQRVAEQLALTDRLASPIATLSRGYRQRVGLAQALVHDPALLILDEPTNGLDPRQIIEIRGLIRALAGRHTVLMSSHILSEVAKTADRVAVLLGGKLRGVRRVDAAGADAGAEGDLEAWYMSLS